MCMQAHVCMQANVCMQAILCMQANLNMHVYASKCVYASDYVYASKLEYACVYASERVYASKRVYACVWSFEPGLPLHGHTMHRNCNATCIQRSNCEQSLASQNMPLAKQHAGDELQMKYTDRGSYRQRTPDEREAAIGITVQMQYHDPTSRPGRSTRRRPTFVAVHG